MPVPEASAPVLKIRGDNPPAVDIPAVQELRSAITARRGLIAACIAGAACAALLSHYGACTKGIAAFAIILSAVGCGLLAYDHNKIVERFARHVMLQRLVMKDGNYATKFIDLHTYNTEFTAPLADRSTLRVTVHFQIPRNFTPLVEQLNRVAEAKLIVYTQEFFAPPSRLDIEGVLNRELVRFQNENEVPVLRVQVPIAIHVHPDKSEGVNV
jgi:hypothetical protein